MGMTILWTILIGFFIGLVAKLLMPGRDGGGFLVTTLLGVGGAVVASLLGSAVGLYAHGEPAGLVGSVIGAMIILLAYRSSRRA